MYVPKYLSLQFYFILKQNTIRTITNKIITRCFVLFRSTIIKRLSLMSLDSDIFEMVTIHPNLRQILYHNSVWEVFVKGADPFELSLYVGSFTKNKRNISIKLCKRHYRELEIKKQAYHFNSDISDAKKKSGLLSDKAPSVYKKLKNISRCFFYSFCLL